MKKTLFLLTVFIVMMIPSFAAPICTMVTLDTLLAGGVNAAQGCQVSDTIFSSFSYAGDIAPSNIGVAFESNGPIPAGATIELMPINGASWAALANLTFTTRIDATLCASCRFVSTLDQILTPPTPNPDSSTFAHPGFVSVNLNGSTPANLSGQTTIGGIAVVTQFTQTGGTTLQRLSSTFSQDLGSPEPSTFALLGGGLFALALCRKKVLISSV